MKHAQQNDGTNGRGTRQLCSELRCNEKSALQKQLNGEGQSRKSFSHDKGLFFGKSQEILRILNEISLIEALSRDAA